jgi:hypothetical protein
VECLAIGRNSAVAGVGFDSEAANLHESMEQLLRCENEFFAAEGRMSQLE